MFLAITMSRVLRQCTPSRGNCRNVPVDLLKLSENSFTLGRSSSLVLAVAVIMRCHALKGCWNAAQFPTQIKSAVSVQFGLAVGRGAAH